MIKEEDQNLANAISEFPPHDPHDPDESEVEAMLTKFVVVSEWVDTEGNRYLAKRSATGMGESVPHWDVKGLLHEGLFGDF